MKKEESLSKCLFDIVLCLIIIQAIFLEIKRLIFQFMDEELFSRSMVTMISMIVGIIFLCVYRRWRKIKLSVLPVKFGKVYTVATFFAALFFVVTLFLIRGFSLQNMLMILYGGIVTPVFEELLFRGTIWNKLSYYINKEWKIYLFVTVLFGLWHIGYAIGIFLWQGGNILHCMIMKVLWGLLYGLFIGVFRLKTKNCYLGILAHGVLNVFG